MTRSATIVGSGPNGLAAALALARDGIHVTVLEAESEIGGGTRSHRPFTTVDLLVDHCAGFHPMAVGSPALAGLEQHGLTWRWPEIDCAHPLLDDAAALLHRSINETAVGLGADGKRWRALFGQPSSSYDRLSADLLGPVVHLPRHPLLLARFGAPTALPAAVLSRVFTTPQARALFVGAAAHAMRPLTEVFSSAIGVGILTAGHHNGWPVAEGGTAAISLAMHSALVELGATVQTSTRVASRADLPSSDITIFDTTPAVVADVLGQDLTTRTRRSYNRFRHGPAAFKVDLAVRGESRGPTPGSRRPALCTWEVAPRTPSQPRRPLLQDECPIGRSSSSGSSSSQILSARTETSYRCTHTPMFPPASTTMSPTS